MVTVLDPPYQTISTIRNSIQSTLKTGLPNKVLVDAIAPFISTVNLWSTQIPAVLDGNGSVTCVNLVFAIRKDIFVAPLFTQNVFGLPVSELPAVYHEFHSFIQKLIEAQKSDKEKPPPKVRLNPEILFINSPALFRCQGVVLLSPKPILKTMKPSKSLLPLV